MDAESAHLQLSVIREDTATTKTGIIAYGSCFKTVADLKGELVGLSASRPDARFEVYGEHYLCMTQPEESATLAQLFTNVYQEHAAAAAEVVEHLELYDQSYLRLKGQEEAAMRWLPSHVPLHHNGLNVRVTVSSDCDRRQVDRSRARSRSAHARNNGLEQPWTLRLRPMDDREEPFLIGPLPLGPDTSVSDLMECIAADRGVSVKRQRLIFNGRVLRQHTCLGEYDMDDGCIVHFVPRPADMYFARAKKHMGGGVHIIDPYRICMIGEGGKPKEVWVSAHDTMGKVKYAMGLVDPIFTLMAPEGLSEEDKREAAFYRSVCDSLEQVQEVRRSSFFKPLFKAWELIAQQLNPRPVKSA